MSRTIPNRLGEKLKAIRLHLGYTLDEMADAVGKEGVSRRTRVYEWETGERQPDLKALLVYAQLAHVSTDNLIDDTVEIQLSSPGETKPKT